METPPNRAVSQSIRGIAQTLGTMEYPQQSNSHRDFCWQQN